MDTMTFEADLKSLSVGLHHLSLLPCYQKTWLSLNGCWLECQLYRGSLPAVHRLICFSNRVFNEWVYVQILICRMGRNTIERKNPELAMIRKKGRKPPAKGITVSSRSAAVASRVFPATSTGDGRRLKQAPGGPRARKSAPTSRTLVDARTDESYKLYVGSPNVIIMTVATARRRMNVHEVCDKNAVRIVRTSVDVL